MTVFHLTQNVSHGVKIKKSFFSIGCGDMNDWHSHCNTLFINQNSVTTKRLSASPRGREQA
jgi:hypothetical protein